MQTPYYNTGLPSNEQAGWMQQGQMMAPQMMTVSGARDQMARRISFQQRHDAMYCGATLIVAFCCAGGHGPRTGSPGGWETHEQDHCLCRRPV